MKLSCLKTVLVTAILVGRGPIAAAAPEHKNLQVLPKSIPKAQLKAMMESFTAELGVKCTFCHVPDQYEKDERPHKLDARRMIRLVLDMKAKKALYFAQQTKDARITCGLCHQGKSEPAPRMSNLLGAMTFFPAPGPSAQKPKNLQVLPKTTTNEQLKKMMEGFSSDLGVKCEFCHAADLAADGPLRKADARRMIRLVQDLKARRVDYFGPRVNEAVIGCGLCHRGQAAPAGR